MKILTKENVPAMSEYLKRHVEDCIYLYIDLHVCGVDHPNMTIWYDEDENGINTVVMKYYNSFQIFSAYEDWNQEETSKLIEKYEVLTICGKESMIKKLETRWKNQYDSAYGVIVNEKSFHEFPAFHQAERASEKDAAEIARLMCEDEEFGMNYDVDSLAGQLADRMRTHTGDSFVIRQDGEIAAHVAVFAEYDDIAVESGLIVSPKYKKNFYGMILHEFIKKQLMSEGKRVFGFRIKDAMVRCTRASHGDICGYYGKLTRKGGVDCEGDHHKASQGDRAGS